MRFCHNTPGCDPAIGARIARPLASGCKAPRRPQPPQHAVGRHAHMPPEPGALCSGPRWFRRPGCGGVWAPRPTKNQACSRSATLHPTQALAGRCGHRPLRPRLRPSRRGGLYGRPAPGIDSRRGPSVPPAVGARIARLLASGCKAPRRPQPPQHAVGRHAHMPPEPGALCSGPRWFRRPGCGGVWAPRPTKNQACSRSATLHPTQELAGRCGHRPYGTKCPSSRFPIHSPAPAFSARRSSQTSAWEAMVTTLSTWMKSVQVLSKSRLAWAGNSSSPSQKRTCMGKLGNTSIS